MKSSDNHSSFQELLAGYVLGDLSESELPPANRVLDTTNTATLQELEQVAAIASLTFISDSESYEPMPAAIRETITADGHVYVKQQSQMEAVAPTKQLTAAPVKPSVQLREAVAWLACLAASFMAIIVWQSSTTPSRVETNPAVARREMITSEADLIQTSWADGKTPLNPQVMGDVVWSNASQTGYMRFVNLPINDPTIEQYQLWIIDPSRDDEPIDGGVFDITSTNESIVAIQAKLKVNQPTAFAVTIEKPGGVVVSSQERLPLLAVVR